MRARWFGPSLDGIKSCTPRTWQGWIVSLATTGAMIGVAAFFHPAAFGYSPWYKVVLISGIFAAYLAVVYTTYDPDL